MSYCDGRGCGDIPVIGIMVKWLTCLLKCSTGYHWHISLTVKHWLVHPLSLSPSFIPQVMHGGLFSTDDVTLDDLRKIDRNRQPPEEGITTVGREGTLYM